jgi:hypothetical protein
MGVSRYISLDTILFYACARCFQLCTINHSLSRHSKEGELEASPLTNLIAEWRELLCSQSKANRRLLRVV